MPEIACVQAPEYESDLVDRFLRSLVSRASPWDFTCHMQEFEYSTGRTDVVAATAEGLLIAFEAKLTRWRDALAQAYKNRAFANISYVVMPLAAAEKSAQYAAEFEKYGVGLCTIRNDRVYVLIHAKHDEPLLEWLADKARVQLAADY